VKGIGFLGLGIQRFTLAAIAALALVPSSDAQPAPRRATNVAALLAYPGFFHQRPVVVVGKVTTDDTGQIRVADGGESIHVVVKDGGAPDGVDEIRGEFWDLGRMRPDEPRLAGVDLRKTFQVDPEGPWPRPGEVTAIMASTISPASMPLNPSIRGIVLHPSRYLEQRVTITGQFSGLNLNGDLPEAPAKSRYDFVLRSADAAIWVTNIRPKGRDFDFALDSRLDTARWLEVSGTVQRARGLLVIDADAGSLVLAKPQTETVPDEREVGIRVPSAPPPEVLFSAPSEDENDVLLSTNVRIQFSRDLDPATLKGRVRVSYLEMRDEPTSPSLDVTTQYSVPGRVLEVRFDKPLDRFRTVKVELVDGILGTDQQPLKPWTLTFVLGGS
jgi:hypothetical protein